MSEKAGCIIIGRALQLSTQSYFQQHLQACQMDSVYNVLCNFVAPVSDLFSIDSELATDYYSLV